MSVQTAIRILPTSSTEKQWFRESSTTVKVQHSHQEVNEYHFDRVFDQHNTKDVFDSSCQEMIKSVCDGFNVTIVAYGQSGAGKTHTTIGSRNEEGIMPLSVKYLLEIINKRSTTNYMVKTSAFEVYNEKVYDLLDVTSQKACNLVDEKVVGAIEQHIQSFDHFTEVMNIARNQRKVGETNSNRKSSRSHAIFQIVVESLQADSVTGRQLTTFSRLLIVDLAGSENARLVSAGIQTTESKNINLSLLALSKLISKIADNPNDKIATFRESKLTRILQPAFGGNSKLLLLCCIRREYCPETNSTISFGQKAKKIKNHVKRNEQAKDAELPKLLDQINELKRQLEEKTTKQKEEEVEKENRLESLRKIVLNSNFVNPVSTIAQLKDRRRHSIACSAFPGSNRNVLAPITQNCNEDWKELFNSVGKDDVINEKCFTEESNSGRSSRMSGISSCESDSIRPEIENLLSSSTQTEEVMIDKEVYESLVENVTVLKQSIELLKNETEKRDVASKTELETAKKRIEELTAENYDISSRLSILDAILAENENYKKMNAKLEEQYEEMKAGLGKSKEEAMREMEDKIQLLEKDLEEERSSSAKLKKELQSQKEKYSKMKSDGLELLQKERDSLKNAIESADVQKKEVERLRTKYNEGVSKYNSLRETCETEVKRRKKRENEIVAAQKMVENVMKEEKDKRATMRMKHEEDMNDKDELLEEAENTIAKMRLCRSFGSFAIDGRLEDRCFNRSHLEMEAKLRMTMKHRDILVDRMNHRATEHDDS